MHNIFEWRTMSPFEGRFITEFRDWEILTYYLLNTKHAKNCHYTYRILQGYQNHAFGLRTCSSSVGMNDIRAKDNYLQPPPPSSASIEVILLRQPTHPWHIDVYCMQLLSTSIPFLFITLLCYNQHHIHLCICIQYSSVNIH